MNIETKTDMSGFGTKQAQAMFEAIVPFLSSRGEVGWRNSTIKYNFGLSRGNLYCGITHSGCALMNY